MYLISPDAVPKVAAPHLGRSCRLAYGVYAVSGLLLNHESAWRKVGFFARKLMDGVLRLASADISCLSFGGFEVRRDFGYSPDFGYAPDYGRAMNVSEQVLHVDPSLYRPADIAAI